MKKQFNTAKFAADIKKARGDKPLKDFSEEIGIGLSTLHRIEGGNQPAIPALCAILVYTNWDLKDYITNNK